MTEQKAFSMTAYSNEVKPNCAWIKMDEFMIFKREVDKRIKELEAQLNNYQRTLGDAIEREEKLEAERNRLEERLGDWQRETALAKAERDKLREALKIQALKTAYFNGHGRANSNDLSQTYPTGELLWKRYLCKEGKQALKGE